MSEDNVIPFPKPYPADKMSLDYVEKSKVPVNENGQVISNLPIIPTARKMDVVERKLEVKAENKTVAVEDGHEFIKNLKKEASRQKSMKTADSLLQQTLDIEFVPDSGSVHEEIALAESFEIIEE